MGRYDLRPLHVHQEATQLLQTRRLRRQPPWYHVVRAVPPTQALVRTLPVQHQTPKAAATRKPSKMFRPLPIVYPEDRLRREFFADHPWELARPRMVLEDDGKDWQRRGGSELRQPGQGVSGENVVQRQMWLMTNGEGMTAAKAYDQARQEFYAIRHQEDVERRVAKEEALATGAYFGKGYLQIGMELEDKEFEQWKEWVYSEAENRQQASIDSVWTGATDPESDEAAVDPDGHAVEGGTE